MSTYYMDCEEFVETFPGQICNIDTNIIHAEEIYGNYGYFTALHSDDVWIARDAQSENLVVRSNTKLDHAHVRVFILDNQYFMPETGYMKTNYLSYNNITPVAGDEDPDRDIQYTSISYDFTPPEGAIIGDSLCMKYYLFDMYLTPDVSVLSYKPYLEIC